MARFKHIDTSPRFLAVDLERQLAPGTFENALHHLIEHELDLTHFDLRYYDDESGAPAYPPAMLLKIVLFAYSRGLVSSRLIAQACVDQVTFIALSGDSQPHFTTIAHARPATLGEDIAKVLRRGARHLRSPRSHRPPDVCHRRRQTPQQCGEVPQWDSRRHRSTSEQERGRRPSHVGAPS